MFDDDLIVVCRMYQGAKYIVVVREPKDVALSFFKFFEGYVAPHVFSFNIL